MLKTYDCSYYMKVGLSKRLLCSLMICVFTSTIVSGQLFINAGKIVFNNSSILNTCMESDIPPLPDNLKMSSVHLPGILSVTYQCKESYMLIGDNENLCLKGKWTLPPSYHPRCVKHCSKFPFPDITLNGKCDVDGETIPCDGLIKPRAIAHISCAFGYREPDEGFVGFIRCNEKAEWDAPMSRCEQTCTHEEYVTSVTVPWHVNIFREYRESFYQRECGGTILSAKIVISFAHCFMESRFNQTYYDPWKFKVVAGNYSKYREYEPWESSTSTLTTQIINAVEFITHTDILILLVLFENIIFTPTIQPVCLEVDYNSTLSRSMETGQIGKIPAWDRNDNLMLIDTTTWTSRVCSQVLNTANILPETFCTKTGNDCEFDRGAGFVLPKTIGEKRFYFLRGVSIVNSECARYSWFLDIQFYNFIPKYINEIRDESDAMYTSDKNFQMYPTDEESTVVEGSCLVPTELSETLLVYYAAQPDREIPKGSFVDPFVNIIYKCEDRYTIIGSNTENICLNGTWNDPNHPECIKFCPPLYLSGVTTSAICEIDGMTVSCLTPLKPNSIARLTCSIGYRKAADSFYNVLRCGDDGEWDYQPFKCEPICGIEAPEAKTYIIGGEISNITKVPWHVGIYSDIYNEGHFGQICGGTILNAKVVISAAHCFWNNQQNQFYNESNFKVAAGKYYRDFYATEPIESQILNVSHIYHKSEYSDYAGLYSFDIALLIVEDHIVFKSYIKPICVETLLYNEKNVAPGLIGRVAGWGLESRGGKSSAELKIIDLPAIEFNECREKFSPDFRPFITPDKFCAGFTDGQSVCEGDSGGGLVFPKIIGGTSVYFLRGTVSSGDNKAGSCDNEKYTIFTNIQYHIDMITFIESTNRPK